MVKKSAPQKKAGGALEVQDSRVIVAVLTE
jgi:hypothetical protein